MSKKALILLSGGQDSTTCLADAIIRFKNVEALCFDYGQRHRIELEQAQKIAGLAGVTCHTIDLSWVAKVTDSALTNNGLTINKLESGIPNTFVPGRNHLFLSVAASYAYQRGIRDLFIGVCETDYSGYPDCRYSFIQAIQKSLNEAMDTCFTIHTPLMYMSKADTVRHMQTLGKLSWYADTHSCYEGMKPACGNCPACQLRLKGFLEAGIQDPITYT